MHDNKPAELSIHFERASNLVLRPNMIIRASRIRVRFQGEEIARVKVQEAIQVPKLERVDQAIITYFDVDFKLWGTEQSAYQFSTWETLEVGEYIYPFALKFPNVNFPPSTDEPAGFRIQYKWSAHLDGASFQPGTRSRMYITPYRPIICSPPIKDWSLNITPRSQSLSQDAKILIHFPSKVFCPDEDVQLHLVTDNIPRNFTIRSVSYRLHKYTIGYMTQHKGYVKKSKMITILESFLAVQLSTESERIPFHIHIPTTLVSPSFKSRHLNVYYEIIFVLQYVDSKGIAGMAEFAAPVGITNLSNDHLLHVPNLTSVQSYMDSKEAPCFFDPVLDAPPTMRYSDNDGNTSPMNSPPCYFSLSDLPAQFIQKEREERTVFSSRIIQPGMANELGNPISVYPEYNGCDW
ncbi:hypothetical protein BDB01DRAFT_729541 [Pilobolus umbonatus]|nr:hypothetical protein BDB01DRAFT_729541 [Pilobolus umbonatus]